MKKIGIILSGCGVFDGSEIHESVLTMLALDRAGVAYQCLAPNVAQARVVNHLTGEDSTQEKRNVLVEAARIARGNIKDIAEVAVDDFAAAIYPGGYGAALNLCDFAVNGASCHIQPDVLKFSQQLAKAHKPQGFICIAPALIAKVYGAGVAMTVGNDPETVKVLTAMGNHHQECSVENIIIDNQHRVVSTPAYMLGKSIGEVATGIERLVQKIVEMI